MKIKISIKSFLTHKSGSKREECEDALACSIEKGRFVVSDGASTSSYSKEWANLLVDLFIEEPPAESFSAVEFQSWPGPKYEEWKKVIPWERLNYFGKIKAKMGAYATLAGMTLRPPSLAEAISGIWEGESIEALLFIVGDACIMKLREQGIEDSWEYKSPKEFQKAPYGISSLDEKNGINCKEWKFHKTSLKAPGKVLIATDAMSKFVMECHEKREPWEDVWKWLDDLEKLDKEQAEKRFESYIEEKRASAALRNDDVAMILLNLDDV